MDIFEDNNPLGTSDEATPRPRAGATPTAAASQPVVITEATKVREGGSRGHITYTVKVAPRQSVRRRYSEFESLQKLLRKLYPCLVVPPIPEKHSFKAYAVSPTRAQEDIRTIQLRKRSLAEFLSRCLATPQICDSWALAKFLDPNVSWKEVLETDEVQNLPRSPLLGPPTDVSADTVSKLHAYLPLPPGSVHLRKKDKEAGPSDEDEFVQCERDAEEYESAIGSGLEKRARRVTKHYTSLFAEYAELGGQLNSFSLDSHGQFDKLAPAVEKVGQAMDQGYVLTSTLADKLGIVFNEPLAESVQMAVTARQVLQYRRQREAQVVFVKDVLRRLRYKLERMREAELEVGKMNAELHIDERIAAVQRARQVAQGGSEVDSVGQTESDEPSDTDDDARGFRAGTLPDSEVHPTVSADARSLHSVKSRGFKLPGLSHLNSALSGLMDADPQTTRRNNITRTQENIEQYEEVLKIAERDAAVANTEVDAEIKRYKTARQEDVRELVRAFIKCHVEWAEKNLESWLDAKQAIESS